MITYVSRRLNIFCIKFKITTLFPNTTTLLTQLNVRVDILLMCEKHLHDRIIQPLV